MSWEIASLVVLAAAIAAGFAWYERSQPPARLLAVVAALAALAVIGRIAFAAFPNVKPTTDIVLLAGYGLGGAPGFAVGAVTALASNFFLLQGPWTPWQMTAWGAVGIAGALLARLLRGREPSRWLLALACGLAGLAFGAVMDVYQWTLAAEQSFASYLAIAATSLPYNLAHAIGNIVFALLIGKPLVNAVRRVRARLDVRWEGAPASVAALALIVALAVPAAAVSKKDDRLARSGDPTTDALTYLRSAQNDDGGFGDDRGDKSNQLFSGWAALAFAAAGYNPGSTTSGGDTLIDYIEDGVKKLDDAPSLARTILVVDASGFDAEKFGGENLVRSLERERDGNGSYGNQVAVTAFALLAQKAAGADGGAKSSARWILEQQNEDGGWAIRSGARSDVDVTASVLQALDATGELGKQPKAAALDWLEKAQNGDGGFGQFDGSSSNSQSTAFAIQGLEAAGEDPARFGGDPIEYLEDQQLKDGSVKYGGGSSRTPVWVTSQAILGFERATLPLSELSEAVRLPNGKTPDQNDLLDKGDDPPKPPDPPSTPRPSPGPNVSPPDPGDFPKPDRPKRPDTGPKPGSTTPGQADLVPPAFSFGAIVPEPEPPSSLTQAADAAGVAAALAAAPGEAPSVEPGQAGDAAATTGARSVLDDAAAAARSAAAAAGAAGA